MNYQDLVNRGKNASEKKEVVIVKNSIDDLKSNLKVVKEFDYKPKKVEPNDFTQHYRERFKFLRNTLFNRPEAASTTSINQAKKSLGAQHINPGFAAMTEDLDEGLGIILDKINVKKHN